MRKRRGTNSIADTGPSKAAMLEARKVVRNWEHEHTNNEDLVAHVAEALDAAYEAGRNSESLTKEIAPRIGSYGGWSVADLDKQLG